MMALSGYWWATGVPRAEPASKFLTRRPRRITEHHGKVKRGASCGVCAGRARLRIDCFKWLECCHADWKTCGPAYRLACMRHGHAWRGHPRLSLQPQQDSVFSYREAVSVGRSTSKITAEETLGMVTSPNFSMACFVRQNVDQPAQSSNLSSNLTHLGVSLLSPWSFVALGVLRGKNLLAVRSCQRRLGSGGGPVAP
jgi:hypothetical protein